MTVFAHLAKSSFKNIESWSSPYSLWTSTMSCIAFRKTGNALLTKATC